MRGYRSLKLWSEVSCWYLSTSPVLRCGVGGREEDWDDRPMVAIPEMDGVNDAWGGARDVGVDVVI